MTLGTHVRPEPQEGWAAHHIGGHGGSVVDEAGVWQDPVNQDLG